MPAAIYYHPEAYSSNGPKLMGRNVAGESFLSGLFRHAKSRDFWVFADEISFAREFSEKLTQVGCLGKVSFINRASISALKQPGVLYYPGPDLALQAFQRTLSGGSGDKNWSLCGITHTTSSARAMDGITSLLTSPVHPWDAVICTSTAVKKNMHVLLEAQVDFLKSRLAATNFVLPQTPVIPLGIHCEDFSFSDSERHLARSRLGVAEDDFVVLFMGRLSFHGKAHPLAMYQALEIAARATDKKVFLIECGWHANEHIEKAYSDAASEVCPSVHVVNIDGRVGSERRVAWACADTFCSLADNIQESFGITPIEAMAAGLPVVVSDWDGYKDTVRDGIDGFRIPTVMPQSGMGRDLALRYALDIDSYDMYCGHTCSLVAVDIERAALAFKSLFQSRDLRRRLGENGRNRARAIFDWKHIIPAYEDLWQELEEIRRSSVPESADPPQRWPARPDPFYAFEGYSSRVLKPETSLALIDKDLQSAVRRVSSFRQLSMINFAGFVIPTDAEIQVILGSLASGPKTASEIVVDIPEPRRLFVFRSLTWFLKLGILVDFPVKATT